MSPPPICRTRLKSRRPGLPRSGTPRNEESDDRCGRSAAACSGELVGSSNENRPKLAEWLRAVAAVVSLLMELLPEYNPSESEFLRESSSILRRISCTDRDYPQKTHRIFRFSLLVN
ncbi:chorismate synthase [Striga asiatica]|uniref:Chorismate synthase n=1 Tax=Striga asiatica TaxID=4170 RepID=A0A5A7NVV3_STRAF|nr:chorismate synthase [Striga asiatica]